MPRQQTMDDLSLQLQQEALEVERDEPELAVLLRRTVLAAADAATTMPGVEDMMSFEDAVACTVCYRLLLQPCSSSKSKNCNDRTESAAAPSGMFCPNSLRALIRDSMDSELLEQGHTMSSAIRQDALAVCRRDPAVNSVLEVVLFSKGYAALVCHRAAYRLWKEKKRKFTALFLQSQASAVFGVDLHPLTQIGADLMFDHSTGIVTGETATIGDGCTILHGVTLGGTGKEHGDRHPKVGNNVLIGAGSSLLGNIRVGDGAKIGAGSVVLRTIPSHATAVGVPAKIIGRATESKPGSDIDETLEHVSLLHKSLSSATISTTPLSESEDESQNGSDHSPGGESVCPFREYARLAESAPPGTVTICMLGKILRPKGCTHAEIGACLFALDTKSVGYVSMDDFRAMGAAVIMKNTRLEKATVESLLSSIDPL